MKMTGRFYFAIFVGSSGYFSPKLRSINQLPQSITITKYPPTPTNLTLEIKSNDLYVKWDS